MNWLLHAPWVIPLLPLISAAVIAVCRSSRRRIAAGVAISSMSLAAVLSALLLAAVIGRVGQGSPARLVTNFRWFELGNTWFQMGWIIDPISALMLAMISCVGLVVFIYSLGYMAEDANFTRFFGFLSLFASAMLALVIANSLLLLFICWELVGLTSYLLIGFWYHNPAAAKAAKKAFVTTRVGDLALFAGMLWLFGEAGSLLFYDSGRGCLEQDALAQLVATATGGGMAVSTAIGLLIFAGAVGKSGQVPLHVWLPDAMEGPTPVSALIHAATMVAAGVFLVARTYPLLSAPAGPEAGVSTALQVVTWVGCITAVFAAMIAVAQSDIKRILAYSTVSQLGYMMMGLGAGGVAVGMFHLVTHAFFKALLFLGAGSVIHGCHHEQDIRRMGGLRGHMPVTFATYAVGMLSLSGFPLLSGFWSKDAILHEAHGWAPSHWPFYLGLTGALLTAFYMTRQVAFVFLGSYRSEVQTGVPHESPRVMRVPLVVLAVITLVLSFLGTPAWPWFQAFIETRQASFAPGALVSPEFLGVMGASGFLAVTGILLGYWLYRRPDEQTGAETLTRLQPDIFLLLRRKFYLDEAYDATIVRFIAWWGHACDWLERWVLERLQETAALAVAAVAWLSRFLDEYAVNPGFDKSCRGLSAGGWLLSRFQNGQTQRYLRNLGAGVLLLVLILACGFLWR